MAAGLLAKGNTCNRLTMKNYYAGIDVGGTKIKLIVQDESGETLEQKEVPTADNNTTAEHWKHKILSIIANLIATYELGKSAKLHCAISAPGLVNKENTMTLHMPERLQGIENYHWSQKLLRPIAVLNDGHAACLAEYESFYRAQGIQHFLMLTLGTGVGGGIIINGELYQGNLQRAGHVGHMTVDSNGAKTMTNMPGSLEYAVGNFSVSERTGGRYTSVRDLVRAYEHGDPKAKEWWLASVRKLAVSLAGLTNILAPECIVLGGGIAAGAGEALISPLSAYMNDYEWRPGNHTINIHLAKLGSYSGATGAAYFAKKQSIKK